MWTQFFAKEGKNLNYCNKLSKVQMSKALLEANIKVIREEWEAERVTNPLNLRAKQSKTKAILDDLDMYYSMQISQYNNLLGDGQTKIILSPYFEQLAPLASLKYSLSYPYSW